jgi:Bacterial Ig-like domain (group 2)
VILALTGLVTAMVHFRDSIPWLTPVNAIELTPNPVELAIGDKFQVVATVRDSNKNPLRKKVKWSIANPALMGIDSDGIVTGNAAGETTITASIPCTSGVSPSPRSKSFLPRRHCWWMIISSSMPLLTTAKEIL